MAHVHDYGSSTRRVRFIANTCHAGQDYGPDLAQQEADVPSRLAYAFVFQGRAVYVRAPGVRNTSEHTSVHDPNFPVSCSVHSD